MKRKKGAFLIAFMLIGWVCMAQPTVDDDSLRHNWKIRLSPYFWYLGIKGSIYKPPPPANYPEPEPGREIDIGFKELSGALRFALMISGEQLTKYTYSRFHVFSLVLSGDAETPLGIVFQDTNGKFSYFGGDVAVGYRVVKKKSLEFDATIGVKWVYADFRGSTSILGYEPFEFQTSKFFIEPALGVHLAWRPYNRLEVKGFGDVGLLFGDHLTYQWLIESNFFITKKFYISLGYRVWSVEKQLEEVLYNGQLYGPITRIGFEFGK
ncbi:MAG: hypothetical protein JXR07_11680 [Reichenbachiella sp.]